MSEIERDISVYGQYIEKDGKRIDPRDFYKQGLDRLDEEAVYNTLLSTTLYPNCNPTLEMAKAICQKFGKKNELVALNAKDLHDFLRKFFMPDYTGNEKKVWRLAREIVEHFGQLEVKRGIE